MKKLLKIGLVTMMLLTGCFMINDSKQYTEREVMTETQLMVYHLPIATYKLSR